MDEMHIDFSPLKPYTAKQEPSAAGLGKENTMMHREIARAARFSFTAQVRVIAGSYYRAYFYFYGVQGNDRLNGI